jgi:ketosteroid isomerase-like protein
MKIINSLLLPALLALPLVGWAAETKNSEAIEQQVTEQVEAFNRAYEVNDMDAYFSFYQEGATMWFNTDFVAIADYQKDWIQMIEQGGGVEQNTLSDLRVTVGPNGDAAVASYRLEVVTRMPDGKRTRDNSQESDTWFKKDGEWRIAHLHYASQPVE